MAEWDRDWGDSRALASASLEHSCTVLIFNEANKVIKAVTTAENPWRQPVWLLHFANDHFSPMQAFDMIQ